MYYDTLLALLILFLGFMVPAWTAFKIFQRYDIIREKIKNRLQEAKIDWNVTLTEEERKIVEEKNHEDEEELKIQQQNVVFQLISLKIKKAGLSIHPIIFLILCGALTCLVAYGTMEIFVFPLWAASLVGVTVGIVLPKGILNFLEHRRKNAFLALFPEALDLMTRGIRSGLSVNRAMESVSEEMGPPVGHEFALIRDKLKLGERLEVVLRDSAKRIDVEDFIFFAVALMIQQETGGSLTEALSNLSQIVRKRQELRLKIKAITSEGRASALIVGALPFVCMGFIFLSSPDYLKPLWYNPLGRVLGGVALGLLITGMTILSRMVKIKF